MPSLAVEAAFTARLATWPNIAACPFVDQNEVADTPAAPPFIEIEYPVADEEREDITGGAGAFYREVGAARFVITVRRFQSGWKAQVMGWVEQLRDLFRGQEFDGVETFEASPPVFDDANADGNRYRVPFVVTYQYDTIK